jgi:hypothetical protein
MKNPKIILDLCGGTEAWSKPYREAGYDIKVVTLPWEDILHTKFIGDLIVFHRDKRHVGRHWVNIKDVYGILAAPPCTMFSLARTNAKTPRDLKEGMKCVRACLEIIWRCMEIKQDTRFKKLPLKFWALENPYTGMLKNFLGKPAFIFDPWEFGDGYQKKTALWGNFNEPKKTPIPMTDEVKKNLKGNRVMMLKKFDYLKSKEIHPEAFGKLTRQERRSITPAGFAKAFFKANQ